MSKFLKRNRQDLLRKIETSLNLPAEVSAGLSDQANSTEQELSKLLRDTQRKKLSIREQLSKNQVMDFSEELSQLKWRIDALKGHSGGKSGQLGDLRGDSLNGKHSAVRSKALTFDELYESQKRKYAVLRERRRNRLSDPQYLDMVGNMQMRKQRRKLTALTKIDNHFRVLDEAISQ